jgi:hypothetical protein
MGHVEGGERGGDRGGLRAIRALDHDEIARATATVISGANSAAVIA